MTQLAAGDKVTWSSQAKGHHTSKTGKVVYVPDGVQSLAPWRAAEKFFPDHRRMFDGNKFRPGSVFIEVVTPNSKAKPRLYMPWPSAIKKVA